MRNKIFKVLILGLVFVLLFGSISAFAFESYTTYTYSIDGLSMKSPTAYSANQPYNSYDMGIYENTGKLLNQSTDIVTDSEGNVYIADKGNNRIVVLNKYLHFVKEIDSFVDKYNNPQTFAAPQGLYVTDENKSVDGKRTIYVCDTDNKRIVVFDENFEFIRTIETPDSKLITADKFIPVAIAVDIYGRIFIISSASSEGVIVLANDGSFTGYIGAQKTSKSAWDAIWDMFRTAEQRATEIATIADPYTNITVDEYGFVYVVSSVMSNKSAQMQNMKTKSSAKSPVKKLNSTGVEIMKRNGFFDPSGEVDVFYPLEVSVINDIALGAEGTWTILDKSRSRFFTYDQNGNLLFAFGDGSQLYQSGNCSAPVSITYQAIENSDGEKEYYLLCLDDHAQEKAVKINVYSPTDYCDTIMSALRNQNEHNYSASIDYWQDVLTQNNNFDLAYIGIGKALFNQDKYQEAQEILQRAYETDYASKAFTEIRKGIISKWLIPLLILVIALVFALVKFLGYAKKKNKMVSLKVGRKTYGEELLYVFHLIFHPFDGFWDLKHEKRGSVRAASTFIGITVIAFFYNSIGKGYLFNPRGSYSNVFASIALVIIPVALWVVGNWSLTTLFEGEGSLKDIYIATGYSVAPLAVFQIASTVMTNLMSASETKMVTLVATIGVVWTVMLLFFGTMITHDYSMGKNVITILGTIVAMIIIVFIVVLFGTLVMKMVTFVVSLVTEIANRA